MPNVAINGNGMQIGRHYSLVILAIASNDAWICVGCAIRDHYSINVETIAEDWYGALGTEISRRCRPQDSVPFQGLVMVRAVGVLRLHGMLRLRLRQVLHVVRDFGGLGA